MYNLEVLFDDDGRVFFAHGSGAIFVTELSANFQSIVTPARQIYKSPNESLKGSHVYKKDELYYICNPAGVREISTDHRKVVC